MTNTFVRLNFDTIENHEEVITLLPSGVYLQFNGSPNYKDVYILMTEEDFKEFKDGILFDYNYELKYINFIFGM